jgi:RHS repeat-associated protein
MRWIKPHAGDSGFESLLDVQWGYNRASLKTWRKDLLAPASTGQDQHFRYDGLYQVTERQRGLLNVNTTAVGGIPEQQENFSYDETGNWITYRQRNEEELSIDETRVNNRSNQITQVDGSSAGVSYDANGNMLSVPTGEGLTGPSRKLEWDAWNRLVKVSEATDDVVAAYQYDGRTRRTFALTNGISRHYFYNDKWRSIEERLDATITPVNQQVWHPANRWELLFRDHSTANNGMLDDRLYSLKDQLDPVAVCNASGSVVERYEYTAFGIPTILNANFTEKAGNTSSYGWNFLFHGEFEDLETGWFNYGYRYYVPTLGRWLSKDPIREAGGLNLYAIMSNNAVNQIDVVGLYCEDSPIGSIGPGGSTVVGCVHKSEEQKSCKSSNEPTSQSQDNDKCGPDATDWFTNELNKVYLKLTNLQSSEKGNLDGLLFMYRNGNNVDATPAYSATAAQRQGCATGKCGGTYMLFGKCVTTWTMNNILFGFVSELMGISDHALRNMGADFNNLQKGQGLEGIAQRSAYSTGDQIAGNYLDPSKPITSGALESAAQGALAFLLEKSGCKPCGKSLPAKTKGKVFSAAKELK